MVKFGWNQTAISQLTNENSYMDLYTISSENLGSVLTGSDEIKLFRRNKKIYELNTKAMGAQNQF